MSRTIIGDIPRIHAGRVPNRLAYIDGERRVTWAEFDQRVNRLAHLLRGPLALKHGDSVAILADNCLEFADLMFAASRAGLIYTGLNTRHHVDEMHLQLKDCSAAVLIAGARFDAQARVLSHRLGIPVLSLGNGSAGVSYDGQLAAMSAEEFGSHGDPELPYALTYTSGTTGAARGAVITSRGDIAYAMSLVVCAESKLDDRHLLLLPQFHKGGQFATLHPAWLGLSSVILPVPDSAAICRAIQTERVTTFVAVPTVMRMLIAHLRAQATGTYDLSSLRHITYGSEPIPLAELQTFAELFGCSLAQIGGIGTEGGVGLSLSRTDHERAFTDPAARTILGSCGRVQPGVEFRIVDQDGQDVAAGEVGEMVFRGDAYVSGYHNNPDATARLWRNGWLHSGDLGRMDSDGYVYYVERLGGRIKTGAETVLAREVEEVLARHAEVEAVSVVGKQDEKWGQIVCAVVQRRGSAASDDILAEELRNLARERLARYKVPKTIMFVDQLPRTPLGKIARGQVTAMLTNTDETRRPCTVPSDAALTGPAGEVRQRR